MTSMSVCGFQIQGMAGGDIRINACRFYTITFSTTKSVLNMQEQMSSKKKQRDCFFFFLQSGAQNTNLNKWQYSFLTSFHCQLLFAVSILSTHALYFF